MIVPIPPVVAAIGTPSNNAFVKPDLFPSAFKSGISDAITIAVAAVFDMSIEAIIVVNIKPMSRFLGFVPATFNVNLKSASSSPVFVIAAARKNPPNISQITLLENVVTYLSIFSAAGLRLLFPNIKTR